MSREQRRRVERSRRRRTTQTTSGGKGLYFIIGGVAVVLIAVVAIVAFGLMSGSPDGTALAEAGNSKGEADAPVTMLEFGDFQ